MATPLTPNQVVASNLRRARELRGLTQEEAANLIEPYLGERWSKALFSNAERSIDGRRIRPFSADELVAFSRAFHLPVTWFLLPPDASSWVGSGESEPPLRPHQLVDLVFNVDADPYGIRQVPARLAELFDQIPDHERTEAQRRVERHGKQIAATLLARQLGDAMDLAGTLRDIADSVESAAVAVDDEIATMEDGA